jgi:hypothetical protein
MNPVSPPAPVGDVGGNHSYQSVQSAVALVYTECCKTSANPRELRVLQPRIEFFSAQQGGG